MEIKPEKQKTMRRDHWMCRIYKFTYGREYSGLGFCPLFHASMVALGLLPFTLAGHAFDKTIKVVKDCWPQTTTRLKKPKKYWPSDYELESRYFGNASDIYGFDDETLIYSTFLKWEESNPTWRADYKEVLDKRKEQKEIQEQRHARLEAVKEKIGKIGKYFVKPGLVLSAATICYFIWKLATYVLSFISFENIVSAALILVAIAGFGAILWGTGKLFMRGVRKIDNVSFDIPVIFTPVSKTFGFLGHLIEFVKDLIYVVYKKNCPLIQWSEKTGPIEKIK